ncbi:DUF2975 domain-containing protein [uncultured Serinicoccus sp.]|uniref:DUF2975 domain-containing protein n=1 Tax=uncultured Serinicoccus sp. TaxID=735514 RepID=UPI0026238723|nr:DUF2975 domain-containing protein [uncultured Serinicoccus sp.]
MDRWVVRVLQGVIAVALLGSLVVQLVIVPLLWLDLEGAPPGIRTSLAVIGVLGVLTLQVVGVCVWRLLTMVSRHTVFSPAAFRWVDVAIGAIGTGALLLLALAVVARNANHAVEGDAVAPGVVGLIGGAGLVVGGVALLVYVMRTLLAQAISLGVEARSLQSELDEVI